MVRKEVLLEENDCPEIVPRFFFSYLETLKLFRQVRNALHELLPVSVPQESFLSFVSFYTKSAAYQRLTLAFNQIPELVETRHSSVKLQRLGHL